MLLLWIKWRIMSGVKWSILHEGKYTVTVTVRSPFFSAFTLLLSSTQPGNVSNRFPVEFPTFHCPIITWCLPSWIYFHQHYTFLVFVCHSEFISFIDGSSRHSKSVFQLLYATGQESHDHMFFLEMLTKLHVDISWFRVIFLGSCFHVTPKQSDSCFFWKKK